MVRGIIEQIKRINNKGLTVIYIVSLGNMTFFISLLLLLNPMWYNINKGLVDMLSITFPWLLLIGVLLIVFSLYLFVIIVRIVYSSFNGSTFSAGTFHRIFPIPIVVIFDILLVMLIDGVAQEMVVAWREFWIVFPYLLLMLLIAMLIFLVPLFSALQNFRGRIYLFAAVLSILFLFNHDFSSPSIIAGPYLQRVTEDRATITWITNRKSFSYLEYGEDELNKKIVPSIDGIFPIRTVHRVTVKNLKEGSIYKYRVTAKPVESYYAYHIDYGEEFTSNIISFRTNDRKKESVRFFVFNDIHEQQNVIPEVLGRENKFDFIFINGDYFDHIDSEEQLIEQLLSPVGKQLKGEIPFHMVRGNHEARGEFALKLKNYINCDGCGYYYSFSHGPVRFIVLDAGEDKPDSFAEYEGLSDFDKYRTVQKTWLAGEIQSNEYKSARYRIVLMHIPPYVKEKRDEEHGVIEAANKYAPLFQRGKVDCVITGHTHRYAILPSSKDHSYPVVTGGGKWVVDTYIDVRADNNKLNVAIKELNGKVLESVVVE